MKRVVAGVGLAAGLVTSSWAQDRVVATGGSIPSAAASQSLDGRWEALFNFNSQYFSTTSSAVYPGRLDLTPNSQRSQLFYESYGLQVNGQPSDVVKLQFTARSGYVWARIKTSAGNAAEVDTPTDTSVAWTATYTGFTGIQPFVSLNVNLPTGRTVFLGPTTFTKQNPDIVGFASYGEGLNVGPTVGANISLASNLIWSIGLGYTHRGKFDREGPVDPFTDVQRIDEVHPGNVTTINTALGYRGERLSLSASVSYSFESTTELKTGNQQDADPWFRAGNKVFVAAGVGYAWTDAWASRLTGSYSHQERNKNVPPPIPPIQLVLEAFNTNADVATVKFDTMYTRNGLSIGPTVGYLRRERNGYDPMNALFLPAMQKWSAGGVAQYFISQQVSFNARVEHMWLDENEHPTFIGTVPPIISRAWLVALGGLFRF